uniref:Dentin sialophosphoprotein-like n=1 Tax=Ascaris lumbricoides TaxID=6252 RepID=A0A0M3HRX2_ASCLU
MSEGKRKGRQMVYVTGSSKLQTKKPIREQDKIQNTESEQKFISHLFGVLTEKRSSLQSNVEDADDIMSELDLTQADSTVSSEDDERKKSSGPNNNNKAVKIAARGRAKGAEKRCSLKKCRDSVQNDNKALPDNEKKAKDDSGQEANVGGILRSDETESAEISCSPVKDTQSDENSASDRSSPINTKKTKGKIYDDEHKGSSEDGKIAERRKSVNTASLSNRRKWRFPTRDSNTTSPLAKIMNLILIDEQHEFICLQRSAQTDVIQHWNPKALRWKASKHMNAAVQSDLVEKQFANSDDNDLMNSRSLKSSDIRGPSSEPVVYSPNVEDSREKMSTEKPQSGRGSASPGE